MKRCLICDDHAMMREAIGGVVEGGWPDADIRLVADYPSAWTAMADAPDLCISDLVMPGATPLSGIEKLRQISPETPILIITGDEDEETILALYQAGIAGFVAKSSQAAVVEAAIRIVLAGERYLPERILKLTTVMPGDVIEVQKPRLTERQRDVLRLIAAGQSNKEIARELELSPATVKVHAAAAIATLGSATRIEAVVRAQTLGMI